MGQRCKSYVKRGAALLGVAALCLFGISTVRLYGQSASTGTVAGMVTDNSGAAVPGATITITNLATGNSRTTISNKAGQYIFAYVDPGTYNIKIVKQGFKSFIITNQVVRVGTQLTENAVLQVGAVSTTVTVTSTPGAELQTLNATVGTTISGTVLLNLPNASRDATTLATLEPGSDQFGNVAGAVEDQNTFQLDGGFASDDMGGDNNTYLSSFNSNYTGVASQHGMTGAAPSAVVPTPVTSIQEFKVSTAGQTADFNGSAGSQVQMVTKRGTNTFHGTVYEYYLDDNFGGANTWDNNSTGTKQPSYHFNRFGAAAGGRIPHSNFLGGNWYIFGNYEGYRFPHSVTFERNMPTASLRAGLIKLNGQIINLNPTATVDPSTGQLIQPTQCPDGPCDPRGLGINPIIQNLWNKYLPLPNDFRHGDGLNFAGYKGTISIPQSSNFGVARIDHDFAKNWHFNATYHYYHLHNASAGQWDIGGFFPGDTKGQYAATRSVPQVPWLLTAGLTTDISPSLTNDFHWSYTRNWWAYGSMGGVPNTAGFPANLEVGGEQSGAGSSPLLAPYNTNNQSTRTRVWDGLDYMYRDDVTWIHGNHLLQFGGLYQRNHDIHTRDDNGGSINTYEQYLIGEGLGAAYSGTDFTGFIPDGITSTSRYKEFYSMILGMVNETQSLYTRSVGSTLALRPRVSCAIQGVAATADCLSSPPAENDSIIPTYNVYLTDAWHLKPHFTLNYGVGYTIEMPPYEVNGGYQSVLVDQNGNILYAQQYLQQEKQAALQGLGYAPALGFSAIRNVPGHSKYPYDPFYGGVSPRLGMAWNFRPDTVLRAGWSRIFGRLNGVDPVLVPILAPGLMQTATCNGPTNTGTCGATPFDEFRVGVDGTNAPLPPPVQNLPQPWYPGLNGTTTGPGEVLDPSFRPDSSDEFTVSIQHQFNSRIMASVGYIGRIMRNEFQAYSLTAVPYMMTKGGQTFANAWANVMLATNYGNNLSNIPVQPFFEAALTPAYCAGYANCTTAFVQREGANGTGNMTISDPWDAWVDASTGVYTNGVDSWTFGRSMTTDPIPGSPLGADGQSPDIFTNMSNGYGNYNAGYLDLTIQAWRGLTLRSNFTMSKALGTGNVIQASSEYDVVDNWNLHNMYGPQYYDQHFTYNLFFNYQLPFYERQNGFVGRVLGGWTISPILAAGSGFPVEANTSNGDCASFGEGNCLYSGTYENQIITGNLNYSNTRKSGVCGSNGVGTAGSCQNVFTNPAAAFAMFRDPILGHDQQIGGGGPLRGLPYWNVDMNLTKKFAINERMSSSFYWSVSNVFNHMQPADPCFLGYDPSTFGVLGCGGNVQANNPRQMQFGLSFDW